MDELITRRSRNGKAGWYSPPLLQASNCFAQSREAFSAYPESQTVAHNSTEHIRQMNAIENDMQDLSVEIARERR